MNVVDSSGWLEYFADGPNASVFEEPISDLAALIVPTVSLYEVFKRILAQKGERAALTAVTAMQRGKVVPFDSVLALDAARVGIEFKLPLADSMIFTTATAFEATLWTQDSDFEDVPGVRYFAT